jgi:hypothetical protein
MQKDDRQDPPHATVPGAHTATAQAGTHSVGGDVENAHTWQQPWVRSMAWLAVLFGLTGLIALSATWIIAERGSNRVLDQIALNARRPPPAAIMKKNLAGPDVARLNAAPAQPAATLDVPAGSSHEPTHSAPPALVPEQGVAQMRPALVPEQGVAQMRPAHNSAAALKDACATAALERKSGAAARRASRVGPAASPAARARAVRMRVALQRYRALHPQKARMPLPAAASRKQHANRPRNRPGRN